MMESMVGSADSASPWREDSRQLIEMLQHVMMMTEWTVPCGSTREYRKLIWGVSMPQIACASVT